MRISAWSSDVCSSDLLNVFDAAWVAAGRRQAVALTSEQRERLEYLDGPEGAAVVEPFRGELLEDVGLPRDAEMADWKSVGKGKSVSGSVDLGGRWFFKKKSNNT